MRTAALRPSSDDLRLIGGLVGRVLTGLGVLMLLPAVLAAVRGEWNALSALLIGAALSLGVGSQAAARLRTRGRLGWNHGMVVVALGWIVGALFAAVPLQLSGRFTGMLAAMFDATSALTTTGASVLQDLDHLETSLNLYRHLLLMAGGLGIIVVVLALFSAGGSRLGALYGAEAHEEHILPNVIRTARFTSRVAGTFLVLGTTALTVALLGAGLGPGRAVEHAVNLFLSAFATGGFAPTSASVAGYHSAGVEAVLIVLMLAGTLSFGLHHELWAGNLREFRRNLETRTLAWVGGGLVLLLSLGLVRDGTYTSLDALVRRGLFTLVSALSCTGLGVVDGALFVTDWGLLAPAALVGAMAVGGMASSTAGGMKAVRVGLAVKAIGHDIRRLLLPESAVVVTTYHVGRQRILRPEVARAATTMVLLFIAADLAGMLAGVVLAGADVTSALFDAVSMGSNAGFSVGLVAPDMAPALQLVYIVQMLLGRLEFIALLVLVGFVVSLLRRRPR